MFCTTCGKQIINEARFCNFCGAPVRAAVIPQPAAPASEPYSAPMPEQYAASEPVSQPYSVPAPGTESGALSEETENTADISADTSAPVSSVPENSENGYGAQSAAYGNENVQQAQNGGMNAGAFYSAAAPVYPMPGEIPQSGGDPSGNYSAPTAGSSAFAAPELEKPKPERRYTLTHIILCLSSTAIMAIAAGIFAGLYFSVV